MNIHIVKIGGRVAVDEGILDTFLEEAAGMASRDRIVLVHGGGAEVSTVSKKLGLTPRFIDGIRMTSREEMPVVDMVLAGKMNTYLVRRAKRHRLEPAGLSGCDGSLFTGVSIDPEGKNRTGKISAVNPGLIALLLKEGYTPVISSVSMDDGGEPLNINADEAALELAKALKAQSLLYISDIPGVLSGSAVIPKLDEDLIRKHIEEGTINGGMVPKVRSALDAVHNGVKAVIIGGYMKSGDLVQLLDRKRGTAISA